MNIYNGNGAMIPVGGDSNTKSPWINLSHKGKAPDEKGNTIYSFNQTQACGMDGTELDLRMTADGVIVCSHDATMTGTINGVETTMTIVSSNYADLSQLTLFTVDGVDYHPLKFEDLCRMAFYWNWKLLQLDFKSQANIQACQTSASEIIKNTGLSGHAMYFSADNVVESILANDPMAFFDVGSKNITDTVYETLEVDHVWRGCHRNDMGTFVRDAHPVCVWDVGQAQASDVMNFKPNAIQWTGDTDGASLSETFLANVAWD